MIISSLMQLNVNFMIILGIDPSNKGCLCYDEFYKNIRNLVKLTHPETFVVFKSNLQQSKLSMKQLFKSLGGA